MVDFAVNDVTGFGTQVILKASNTYPVGFPITQFADDGNPFTTSSLNIGEASMGLNGDLIKWAKAQLLTISISVIPNSTDDIALLELAKANRVSKGRVSARDVITLVVIYPDKSIATFIGGALTDAPFAKSINSSGKFDTKTYSFKFADVIGG